MMLKHERVSATDLVRTGLQQQQQRRSQLNTSQEGRTTKKLKKEAASLEPGPIVTRQPSILRVHAPCVPSSQGLKASDTERGDCQISMVHCGKHQDSNLFLMERDKGLWVCLSASCYFATIEWLTDGAGKAWKGGR